MRIIFMMLCFFCSFLNIEALSYEEESQEEAIEEQGQEQAILSLAQFYRDSMDKLFKPAKELEVIILTLIPVIKLKKKQIEQLKQKNRSYGGYDCLSAASISNPKCFVVKNINQFMRTLQIQNDLDDLDNVLHQLVDLLAKLQD